MPSTTHKTLFELVDSLIDSKVLYPSVDNWENQLSRSQVLSSTSFGVPESVLDTSEITNTMIQLIADIVPPRIKSGLNVTQTDPISASVIVKAGVGTVAGKIYRLDLNKTIVIPFDSTTYVFYVTLWTDGIQIERSESSDKLTLAKIVVPQPGTTDRVKDRKDDDYEWDAYIVQYQEYKLYGDTYGKLEEDSFEFIRDTMGDILGENIIGNITINENLKILNTAGSIKLDSNSMRIYDVNSNELAKFNDRGVFFYNTSGVELARFTKDDAKIGNILVTTSSIESGNFTSGSSGFKINDSGDAEFNDVTVRGTIYASAGEITGLLAVGDTSSTHIQIDGPNVRIQSSDFVSGVMGKGFRITTGESEFQNIRARGKITTSVFEKDAISVVGGNLLVFSGDLLDADMTDTGNTLVITGDVTLTVNDVLRIKDGTDDEWILVTDISSAPIYTVSRDLAGTYQSGVDLPAWQKGTAVTNYGQPNTGGAFITSSEANSPYMDFFTHDGSPWNGVTSKTRIGNLDGIAGASGYGIYGGDGFLGALEVIDNISISSQGSIRSNLTGGYPYLEFSQSGLQLKDNDTGGTYGTAVYSTDKYGYGALVWIMNLTLGVPWAELKIPTLSGNEVASIRLYNRGSDPNGTSEIGDLAVVGGKLKICTVGGNPGTYVVCGDQTA